MSYYRSEAIIREDRYYKVRSSLDRVRAELGRQRRRDMLERQRKRELSGFYTGLSVATALLAVGRKTRRVKRGMGRRTGHNLKVLW